jgi:hypothetical protein
MISHSCLSDPTTATPNFPSHSPLNIIIIQLIMSDTPPPSAANAAGADAFADVDSAKAAAVNDDDNNAGAAASSDVDADDKDAFDNSNHAMFNGKAAVDVADNDAAGDNADSNAVVDNSKDDAVDDTAANVPAADSAYVPADSSDSDKEMTDGAIVPGTQINYHLVATPYDMINARLQRHAESMLVDPPCILGINPNHESWIRKMMHDDWGIHHPHEFQISAIHQAAFTRDEMLYIIAKTGSGKSAILLTVGTLLTGVVITLVPLVDLGSNRVSKSCNAANYVEAYHVNKHRRKDCKKLRYCLDAMTAREADYVNFSLHVAAISSN